MLPRWWRRTLVQLGCVSLVLLGTWQIVHSVKEIYTPSYRKSNEFPSSSSSPSSIHHDHDRPLQPDNDDINWIVQVSDLHFSKFRDPNRPTHLESFCRHLKKHVDPGALVITGDLTDSKGSDHFSSTLYKEEWVTYNKVIRGACGGLNVLDVKGNHDAFNLAEDDGDKFFQSYSSRGQRHSRSYLESVTFKGSGNRRLGLVAIDATPVPGLKRPFNFFGSLAENELKRIRRLLKTSKTLHSDYTLYFGHYPTGTVLTSDGNSSLRELLAGGVYLCGHLHNFLGLGERMYTMHPDTNLLELELADWKDHRKYRVLAFDQGFLSFNDVKFNPSEDSSNVAVVVTSPKDPLFLTNSDSLSKLKRIKEIRMLVFSDRDIAKVTFNDEKVVMKRTAMPTKNLTSDKSPLFTAPFNPTTEESTGLHTITFTVHLSDGTKHRHEHRFSLDGSQPHFDAFSTFLLLSDWLKVTELIFVAACISVVGFLVALRVLHEMRLNAATQKMREGSKTRSLVGRIVVSTVRKYWMLAATDKLCFPIIGYIVCTSMFPLALAHVLTDRHGLVFVWGIVMIDDLSYIPPDLTFLYGIISVAFVIGPFVIVLANAVERRYEALDSKSRREPESRVKACILFPYRHLGILLLTAVQTLLTRELYFAYGLVSIFSPIGLGRIAFTLGLYLVATRMKREDFWEVYQIWPYH